MSSLESGFYVNEIGREFSLLAAGNEKGMGAFGVGRRRLGAARVAGNPRLLAGLTGGGDLLL